MKLSTRDAAAYFKNPDPNRAGLLIYGADPMRVAGRRVEVLQALLGKDADEEMRLTRMSGAELAKDQAMLNDAVKSVGFFPGARGVLVEEASDRVSAALTESLEGWKPGDASIIVTAGQLKPSSSLRKLFEKHRNGLAAAIYDNPPSRDEIAATLKSAGISEIGRDAEEALNALAMALPPGDFRQTVEKVALFKIGDLTPLTADEVNALAPQSSDADMDGVLDIVLEGKVGEIGPMLGQLYAQGVLPVGLCIGTTRKVRALHIASADPGGIAAGMGRLRPPVFGPRRDAMMRQAKFWNRNKLEEALSALVDTDLQLRSANLAPQKALMERLLIRLAMRARARR